MLFFRPALPSEAAKMAAFISPITQKPAANCLHCGEEQEDIRLEIEHLYKQEEATFVLALENDTIIGIYGGEIDFPDQEIWLWGPFVSPEKDWEAIALQLYQQLHQLHPDLKKASVFKDERNSRGLTFHLAQGFTEKKERAHVYNCAVPSNSKQHPSIRLYQDTDWKELKYLHELAFPDTYYTTQAMLDLRGEKNLVYVFEKNGQIPGYLYMEENASGEGYIHFLAVHPNERRQGIADALLNHALFWIFEERKLPLSVLTVMDKNNARRLYKKAGFNLKFTGVSARWAAG